ncbi:hypothetical protein FGO68_gene154 [Halteria grandinella]|uniref:Mitochondrial import inner membrane translocase subunit tim16 n=1 Tax=Halteria grandinella TaxID=5974 RepID=A0A8J8SZ59_HALGN|nr:hypothetical protein FGO68_gene9728 [Halteria grandinella]TNV75708.1 hypothetical protein FGO68_gene154 [Halteria grandinella]
MVNKFLFNLALEYGARVGKSVFNAYQKVVGSGGAQQTGFGKAAQSTIGRFITKPMTRDEACKILNLDETPELDHVKVMERFETMFQKNNPEKGGSFYIQSKIYFAKEFLMQDFPTEFNKSEFNPDPEAQAKADKEEKAADAGEQKKGDK